MVRKEALDIIRTHLRKTTISIGKMTRDDKEGDQIYLSLQDLFELRSICILAYNNLTGVDLSEEPFTREEDDLK